MAPEGRMVFACWRPFAENLWSREPLMALAPLLKEPLKPADPDLPGPFALLDDGKINRILGASGWRDVSIERWDGPIGVGRDAEEAARFLLKIGDARARSTNRTSTLRQPKNCSSNPYAAPGPNGIKRPDACWIVRASA